MAKLTPYFYSEDSRAQSEFYVQALGGNVEQVMTYGQAPNTDEAIKDKVMHLMLVAAGITFYMADSVFEPVSRGNGLDLNIEFTTEEEARQAFDKLAEGGRILMPLEKQFWGALFGRLEDKFGVTWQINTETPQQ
jgi:PhnB protein